MSLGDHVEKSEELWTENGLVESLRAGGVAKGSSLLVHSSLSSIGYVAGGAEALVRALMRVVGTRGTLVMPAQSSDFTNPIYWSNPPVPESWWGSIVENQPAWTDRTSCREVGITADAFMRMPGVRRSRHPHTSFSAWGKHGARVCRRHELGHSLGEGSPLATVYEMRAEILMIGCSWESCTSLHLAEHRMRGSSAHTMRESGAVLEKGSGLMALVSRLLYRAAERLGRPVLPRDMYKGWQRSTKDFETLQYSTDDFVACGEAYLAAGNPVREFALGLATARIVPLRELVDFASKWFSDTRSSTQYPGQP